MSLTFAFAKFGAAAVEVVGAADVVVARALVSGVVTGPPAPVDFELPQAARATNTAADNARDRTHRC